MKRQLLIILTLLTIKSYGQCGREYPSGLYHNSKFVNTQGDTLNKLDSSGLYHGLHLYTDNPKNIYNDTNSFIVGVFEHGLPVGEWKDHCKDGSFSLGQFSCGGGESSSDGKGGWVTKQQGIYTKIGIWKYFDKDSHLLKTMRYDRFLDHKGWNDDVYEMDSVGNFILIEYEFNSKRSRGSMFKMYDHEIYTNNGTPVFAHYEGFYYWITDEYNEKGELSKTIKKRRFLGKTLKTTIIKEYNSKGQVKCKTKTKCKHPDNFPVNKDHFI